MTRPTTLFKRTAITIALGLLVFQIASAIAMFAYLVLPLAQRSANDLADLLILSANIWTELSPDQRSSFETELQRNYDLTLIRSKPKTNNEEIYYPYIRFLRTALIARLPGQNPIVQEENHEQFHIGFKLHEREFYFAFSKNRVSPRPKWALSWIILSGITATLILAWLLARRISKPVANLARAARRIGTTGQITPLPETGDVEFVELAQIFNETSRQLQAQRENQTTLLAGVSHDLRTPLARMKMALGLLAEENNSPLLERIERDISEMDQLIGAQLELARAQEAEAPEKTDLHTLLTELADATEAQAPGRLQLRISKPSCVVEIAQMSLRRCITNLVNNALRYAGTGDIQIVCRHIHGQIFIGIRDRGPGIPAELAETVFRPFYRLESSRSRTTGGSGLGLAITRQLSQTQGWHVAIKHRYGGGTSVWIQIKTNRNVDWVSQA